MLADIFSQHTLDWFKKAVGEPTPVQVEGWHAIAQGGDVLVSAPTGTGKTLTAFLYWLDYLAGLERPLKDGCVIVYVSPLKALGNDIRENLNRPLEGLGLSGIVRAAVRTGDTTQAERAKMLRHPPQIIITTPESLFLLLTSRGGRQALGTAQCVIIDELHSMIESKRGAHLMLSLERLDELCGRRLQRIGLSATIQPLDMAADYLSGGRGAKIVSPVVEKDLSMRVELAEDDFRQLPEHSIWPAISERTYELSQESRTTLAFVDGRSQAEKLAYGINNCAEEQYARTHHGCVSKEQRLEAEMQLRNGDIRVLCCTATMELGIDVGDIDMVVQVGAPRSIAGAMQRAGRAGHGPGRTSTMIIFPKTEADCLDAILAARGAMERRIEKAVSPEKCLDVISQHIVSMAASADYTVDEALKVINGAWPCRNVSRKELEGMLSMLAGDFEHELDLPVRPRIIYDRINGEFSGDNYSRMLAVSNVGTIPDRGWYTVTLQDGTKLGELDEEYVFEARLGDKFLLGAFAWRINEITREKVIVTPATPEGAQSPFWKGDMMGRPVETGAYYGALMREMNEAWYAGRIDECLDAYPVTSSAREAVKRHLGRQISATGTLPDDRTIIFEHFADSAGDHQLMVHSVFGARVNHALSMLLRHAAAEMTGMDVRGYDDDGGMLLYLMGGSEIPEGLWKKLDPDTAMRAVEALLPAEPMFSMAYRYALGRSDMLGVRGSGRQPLWIQRLRGAESLSGAVSQMGHPLVEEALRECRDDLLDMESAIRIIKDIRAGRIRVIEMRLSEPSPMALPLRRQVEAELMYEAPIPVSAKMVSMAQVQAIEPEKEAIETRYSRDVNIDGPDRLHSILMTEGDLMVGEVEADGAWFEFLAEKGRAMYIEPGLWIAAEHGEEYASGDMGRIVRRCLRYRGPQDAGTIAQRYAMDEIQAQEILDRLVSEGMAKIFEGMYVHRDVYESAQRLTVNLRRNRIKTAPANRFAAMMARELDGAGSPRARLESAMERLCRVELPAQWWEEIVFPARVPGYRAAHIDGILGEGAVQYRARTEDKKLMAAFYSAEDFELGDFVPAGGRISDEEKEILGILEKGGAQFDYTIARRMGGREVSPYLFKLVAKGLAGHDSFAALRRSLEGRKVIHMQMAGRWERACRLRKLTAGEKLERAFLKNPILCRETVSEMSWAEALELLRTREMTGEVRRGYFVKGLGGAQFVRAEDFERVTAALDSDSDEYVCINAVDPAQMWGRVIPHEEGREFVCVPGTAIVLHSGRVACIFERQGASVRIFEEDAEALACFARAYKNHRIFTGKKKICVTEYPRGYAKMFEKAGFIREMLDYTIYPD